MTERTVLDNGIRIVLEKIPHVRSVSLGIWVRSGSRDEKSRENGISHFIEHMLFKGTPKRTARQIAIEIDSIGGVINAFTGKEYSSFYVKVLDEHLPTAIELLSDIFLNSSFDPCEMERERNVILQEIKMVEDSPDELVMDLFHKTLWKGFSLGYPILGNARTVRNIERDGLIDYFWNRYLENGIVITAAGNFKTDNLLSAIKAHFGDLSFPECKSKRVTPSPSPSIVVKAKRLEQVHICIGSPGPSATAPDRYAYYLLNTIYGGGMSSRLFQEIREKQGLAYSVYSFVSVFEDTGMVVTYVGTTRQELPRVLSIIKEQMTSFREKPVEEKELVSAKKQLKGNLLLSLETTDTIMSRLAKNEIYFNRIVPVEEVIEGIERVTPEDIQDAAIKVFKEETISIVALGDIRRGDIPDRLLI
jgi:predicted Zn-dependent peptidase